METEKSEPIHILLIEDNPTDVRILQETLTEVPLLTQLSVVGDGEEALHFLRHEGAYEGVPLPDCILLDMHLPGKNGFAVLEEIHTTPALRQIPVAVCVGSAAEQQELERYHLPIACFFMKGYDPAQLTRVLTRFRAVAEERG